MAVFLVVGLQGLYQLQQGFSWSKKATLLAMLEVSDLPWAVASTAKTKTDSWESSRLALYGHKPPEPRDGKYDADSTRVCGEAPLFQAYFSQQPVGRDLHRSVNKEDEDMYKLFRDRFFGMGSRGKYLELGAFDGRTESNTRFFDECLGWTGLLVEGNPEKYDQLVANRPHAHRLSFAPSCSLEEEQRNQTVAFHAVPFTNGGIEGSAKDYESGYKTREVPCGSLTPVIQELMGGHIHFFSLDVEGSEPSVLKNIDFEQVRIDAIMVESWNKRCPQEPRDCPTRTEARAILDRAGYYRYTNIIVKSDLYIHPESEFQMPEAAPKANAAALAALAPAPPVLTASERIKTLYRHQLPRPRSGTVNTTFCGDAPGFEAFFGEDNRFRSVNNEDRTIYKLFPDQFRALGSEGHYIELGAFDGFRESNTRFFDECLEWSGLLIEGNPTKFDLLNANRPHAHRLSFAPSCSLDEERQNKTVSFHAVPFTNGGIEGSAKDYRPGDKTVDVPCGSLTPVIQEVMGGRIHFFSLDVEGSEPSILQNIDFDKVKIDVLMVESWNKRCPQEPRRCETRHQFRTIMEKAGYQRYVGIVQKSDLFIHPQSEFQLPSHVLQKPSPTSALAAVPNLASDATTRERIRTIYRHQLPSTRNLANIAAKCGTAPQYEEYFSQAYQFRSVNDEDKTIYNLFPEKFRALGSQGHYIELGAFDGLTESNTRFFDECLGWDGLLIEGNPIKYEELTNNRPHAHRLSFAPSCTMQEEQQNKTITFKVTQYTDAGIEGYAGKFQNGYETVEVPCGSLTPVISELMGGRVHFFSLDVEGAEPSVLKNIDFDKVKIDLLMVESWNRLCPKEPEPCATRSEVRDVMKRAGYEVYSDVVTKSDLYVHPQSEYQLGGSSEKSNPAPVSLATKEDRMSRYLTSYKYEKPKERPDPVSDPTCGNAPDFNEFFEQSFKYRSVNNEDQTIYRLFPQELYALGSKGHYIELGAFDGKTESNTRFFDVCLGWTGLLVEGNPIKYDQLLDNRPHSHRMSFAPSCSVEEEKQNKSLTFHAVAFTNGGLQGHALGYREGRNAVEVPCGQLTSVIEDVMDGHIHFFSLDVEGSEPTVLENIDFSRVQIDLLMVESWNKVCPQHGKCPSRDQYRKIMEKTGYTLYENVVVKSDLYIHPKSEFQLTKRKGQSEVF